MLRRILPLIIVSIFVVKAVAQEALKPLSGNLNLIYKTEHHTSIKNPPHHQARKKAQSLTLPFKDDFSYATETNYASPVLWEEDSMVYVNTGFGINPPSIGVATFDGLNKHGYPYTPNGLNMTASLSADTLTSRPINLQLYNGATLQPGDSVALVFYYQARGYGDSPQVGDSLIVDLYDATADTWELRVWFLRGNTNSNQNDTLFRKAFVRINDQRFFHENFRFRIRNRATTTGNFDHWHVDYLFIDRNLNINDAEVYNDVTFAYVPTSLLNNYSAMPYKQYTTNEMADRMQVKLRNNGATGSLIYKHDVLDPQNQVVATYLGNEGNLPPYTAAGYSSHQPHSNFEIPYDLPVPATDSIDFRVRHVIYRSLGAPDNDFFKGNDTIWQEQRFRNYYAFDDGSAEAGYYVNGPGARMAQQIRLNQPDTLRAMRIYFDAVKPLATSESIGFRILVWQAGSTGPTVEQHSFSTVYNQRFHNSGNREIPEYELATPVRLEAGTYFIGIQQQAEPVVVGFDRNYDTRQSLYYNYGGGWIPSNLKGSLMMRPVFGRKPPAPVGLVEEGSVRWQTTIYPNPAGNEVFIDPGNEESFEYTLLNTLGEKLLSGEGSGRTKLETADLNEGIYLVVLKSRSGLVASRRLVIRR